MSARRDVPEWRTRPGRGRGGDALVDHGEPMRFEARSSADGGRGALRCAWRRCFACGEWLHCGVVCDRWCAVMWHEVQWRVRLSA